jgi:hypothetical protein
LDLRGFPRDFPSDFLSNYLSDHLPCFSGLLLGGLAHHKKEHKGDQHNYDQDQGSHQYDGSAAHVLFSTPSSLAFYPAF